MSEVRVNNLSNENNTGGPTISGITTYSGRHFFVTPQGDTASRPSDCEPGSLRFNTDSAHLEYFRGNTIGWVQIDAELTLPLGGGTGSNTGLGVRGLIEGGYDADSSSGQARTNIIDFITLSTLGNAQDFGDMTVGASSAAATASRTRFIKAGGYMQGNYLGDVIEFNTFASTGNATDFGNLIEANEAPSGVSDGVRGVFMGGGNPSPTGGNRIQYIDIATTGNSVDFGDTTHSWYAGFAVNDTVRGIAGGGQTPDSPNNMNNGIDVITIRTTGNATEFGDLTENSGGRYAAGGTSNATRGLIAGGRYNPGTYTNSIGFITMATQGNEIDFGDLTLARWEIHGGMASATRAVFQSGDSPGIASASADNRLDFVQIATTGNAVDFGDTNDHRRGMMSASNGHGGLG